MQVIKPFKVTPKFRPFKVQKAAKVEQAFFLALPRERLINIQDLNPDAEYAFFRYFPDDGGMRVVTDIGANLQRQWRQAVKRERLELFKPAYHRLPSNAFQGNPLTGYWQDVILKPRRDIYFSVQQVHPRHYANRVTKRL